jgi:hypothetical protein
MVITLENMTYKLQTSLIASKFTYGFVPQSLKYMPALWQMAAPLG